MSKTNSFSWILLFLFGLVLPQERKNQKHEKGTHANQFASVYFLNSLMLQSVANILSSPYHLG